MRRYLLALLAAVALCAACSSRPAPNLTFASSILPPPTASISTSLTSLLPTPGPASVVSPLETPIRTPPSTTPVALATSPVSPMAAMPTMPRVPQIVGSVTPSAPPAYYTPPPLYIYDLTFVDTKHGWALGASTGDPSYREGPAVRSTSDGGLTWQAIPAPQAGSRVRFANLKDGWVYGLGVFTTHDGGQSWIEDSLGGEVQALQPAETDVWAVVRTCFPSATLGAGQNCTHALKRWLKGSSPRSATTTPLAGVNGTLVRRGEQQGWMLSTSSDPMKFGKQTVYATSDGGPTWTAGGPIPTYMDCKFLALDTSGTLWALCIGGGATIEQERSVCQSSDGGLHWTEVAAGHFPVGEGLRNMTDSGHPSGLAVASPQTAFVLQGREPPLLATYDGGRTWVDVPEMTPLDEVDNLVQIVFSDALRGWAGSLHGLLYRTEDGGHSWIKSSMP